MSREACTRQLLLVSRDRSAELCARALEHGIEPDYVRELVRNQKLSPPASACETWPYSVHIRALGGFELRVDEQPSVPSRKAEMVPQQMLEALVAMGGQSVERRVLPTFSGQTPMGMPADRVRHHPSSTAQDLGNPAALVLHDGKLSLAREHVWTDLWAVERLLGADGQHSNIGVVERFKNAHKLIELYRGPLYAGSEQTVWVMPRARLHERVVQAVERAAEDLATGGEWTRARILFAEGIGLDPTVEAFYQGVMRCATQLGAKAEVARTYERCRRILKAAFGVEPSDATRELWLRGAKSSA